MFIDVTNKERLDALVEENVAYLLYFSAPTCNVCKDLKPKIERLVAEEFPQIACYAVDAKESVDIASAHNIFSIPTILVFFDGKEFLREGRNMSLTQFSQKIARIYSMIF